ncbi:uncharacterized protein ACBT44_021790 isoform 2-T2 [Syngnathus typhle]
MLLGLTDDSRASRLPLPGDPCLASSRRSLRRWKWEQTAEDNKRQAHLMAIDFDIVSATTEGMFSHGQNTTATGTLAPTSNRATSARSAADPFTTTVREETSVKNSDASGALPLTSGVATSTGPTGHTVTPRPPDPTRRGPTATTAARVILTSVSHRGTAWMTTTGPDAIVTTGQTEHATSMTSTGRTDDDTSTTTRPENNVTISTATRGGSTTATNTETSAVITGLTTSMDITSGHDTSVSSVTSGPTEADATLMTTSGPANNNATTSATATSLTDNDTTSVTTISPTSLPTTGPPDNDTTPMTTTGLTNDPTSVSLTNYTSLTTTSWTNSSASPMTTTGLSNDTSSTTASGPTDSYTSLTATGPTFMTPAGPTDATTTSGPTDSYTSLTATGPTFMTPAGPTDATTTSGPPDRTTWMTPTDAEASTAAITTSPWSTLSVDVTAWVTSDDTKPSGDATTRTTTDPQSDKVTRTTERSGVVSTQGPTPASEATSGATTREATSVLTPTSASKGTQSSPGPTQSDATIVCPAEPCPLESVCLNGTCQCLSGSFLLGQRCIRAQVFPGQLHLTSLTFDKEMLDRSSKVFQETAADISASLAGAFAGRPGYVRSDVVQLAPGSVLATVNNIFDNTPNSEEAVEQVIQDAIGSSSQGLLLNATFSVTKLCDQVPLPCDAVTTWCTSAKGRVGCSCKAGYISTVYSNTSCKACPSGQEVVGNSCQKCAFGYAGFNCTDSSLLALVVISCVLGGILLIIIILALLSSYCCWRRRSGGQAERSDASPYPAGGELTKPWPVGITPIPRATTAATWDAAATMEMMEKRHHGNGVSGSYDLNPDGMKTFTNKNPSRYSYLMQGHENPYFLPGDDKKN